MDEKAAANKLDNIFSDMRLNPIVLGLLTKEIFGPNTHMIAADWWFHHTSSFFQSNANHRAIDLGID